MRIPVTHVQTTHRLPAVIATVLVVAAIVAMNLTQHFVGNALWLGPAAAVGLVVFARWSGLSWTELGMHHKHLRAGLLVALACIAVVAAVYLIGVLLPLTRTAFLDVRYQFSVPGALMYAFVVIPLSTILLEEVAFRSVLWGMLTRHSTRSGVLVMSSSLFGLWHVLPSLNIASANAGIGDAVQGLGSAAGVLVVVGIVAFTAVGGALAGELRRRSGSVLASAGMHWATNGLGVLFGLLAWRLAA